MELNRRDFLITSLAFTVANYSSLSFAKTENDIIIGGGRIKLKKEGSIKHVLSIINLSTQSRHLTDMSFLPHGIHRKPTDTNCLAIFEKKGSGACEYNLSEKKITRIISPQKDRYFYGHGAYSIDGNTLYSTETDLNTMNGKIAIRNSKDMAYLGEFPSYGKEPHECKLIDNGNTLIVTNGGGTLDGDPPSVTYIDIKSQQLLEKVELTNTRLNTGHLAVSKNGSLVVISAPRTGLAKDQTGGVSIRPRGKEIKSIKTPLETTEKMFGEALSICIHEPSGIAAVTHPDGGFVSFWSIQSRQLIAEIKLPYPRGIELTTDNKYFLISYGKNPSIARIPVTNLSLDDALFYDNTYITGSHIYNWSNKMSEIFYPGPLS